jgi:hypothetical protein
MSCAVGTLVALCAEASGENWALIERVENPDNARRETKRKVRIRMPGPRLAETIRYSSTAAAQANRTSISRCRRLEIQAFTSCSRAKISALKDNGRRL